jgi:LETM1 and EF-hand domain-containing protein 1, mitochondrial
MKRGVVKVWDSGKWVYRFVSDRDFTKKTVQEWKAIGLHTWEGLKTGSRLFSKNVSISKNLLHKRAKGHGLTLQEHKLLLRTLSDTFKLVPFSFFIIVPFAELLLPVALWMFPNMLPSTFKELISDGDARKLRRLRAKKEMAAFFEEVIQQTDQPTLMKTNPDKGKELLELQTLLRNSSNPSGTAPSSLALVKFARLFREEFQLENLPIEHLRKICRLLGVNPLGFHSHVVLQLRHTFTSLLSEDKQIRWEGVDSLSLEDLKDALKARGMPPEENMSLTQMRGMLEHWLQLSSVKDMPLTLLLWSRSYAGNQNDSGASIMSDLVEQPMIPASTPTSTDEDRVSRYRSRVEHLLNQLKELEDLEMSTCNPQPIDPTSTSSNEGENSQLTPEQKIAQLEESVKTKSKIIQMQHDILKQQIELFAKLREMPFIAKRRQSMEVRMELKKMYDQFDAELKQLEETISNSP